MWGSWTSSTADARPWVEQPDTPACAGADLIVAEACFFDRIVPFHLAHAALLADRDRLDWGRIVLTHMSPDLLARRSEAAFECAHDGMVVTI